MCKTMFVIYENASNNEVPLQRSFIFSEPTDVSYNGKVYEQRTTINIAVKKKGKVKATSHPISIKPHQNKGQLK